MQFLLVLLVAASWCPSDGAEIGRAIATTENPTPAKCGQSNLSISKDKVIGVKAALGNYPWQVTTFQKDSDSGKWRPSCGGTLVSPRAVLTVSHCFVSVLPEDLNVALGKTNRDYYKTEPTEVKRAVKKIHIHELFKPKTSSGYGNDIATLILDTEIEVTAFTMPVCVDLLNIHSAHIGEITGDFVPSWGNPDECTGDCNTYNSELTYSRASTQDYNTCYKIANPNNKRPTLLISTDKFCSDYVIYRGDSGAALTFVFNNSHYLYGIGSGKFSVDQDGERKDHSLFTNVTYHLDWIKSNLS